MFFLCCQKMRKTYTFQIDDFVLFQDQCLRWADRYNHVLFLKNSSGNSDFQEIMAVGVDENDIFTSPANANWQQDLQQFIQKKQDWVFGYAGYESLENPLSTALNHSGFPDVYFFVPQVIIFFDSPTQATISSTEHDPEKICEEILMLEDGWYEWHRHKMTIPLQAVRSELTEKEFVQNTEKFRNRDFAFFYEKIYIKPQEVFSVLQESMVSRSAVYLKVKENKYLTALSQEVSDFNLAKKYNTEKRTHEISKRNSYGGIAGFFTPEQTPDFQKTEEGFEYNLFAEKAVFRVESRKENAKEAWQDCIEQSLKMREILEEKTRFRHEAIEKLRNKNPLPAEIFKLFYGVVFYAFFFNFFIQKNTFAFNNLSWKILFVTTVFQFIFYWGFKQIPYQEKRSWNILHNWAAHLLNGPAGLTYLLLMAVILPLAIPAGLAFMIYRRFVPEKPYNVGKDFADFKTKIRSYVAKTHQKS
jgi:hypothetical protein